MKVAIFCHFDVHDIVDDYVVYALRSYRQFYDHICFVSSCDLSFEEIAKAHRYADMVICKENIGYDFLSWRTGVESINLKRCSEISFINDSCYGPCRDVKSMFAAGDKLGADLWGASLSRQVRPHVQSFFMTFKAQLISSGFAREFWDSVNIIPDKQELIAQYEIGLSALVEDAGFKIGGVVDLEKISRSTREVVYEENQPGDTNVDWAGTRDYILNEDFPNPAQLYWGEMFRGGSPLLKLENLRTNPMGVSIQNIFARLRRDKWYDVNLILRHLGRVLTPERFKYILEQAEIEHAPRS